MKTQLFRDADVRWDDRCQGNPVDPCGEHPVEVWKSWTNGRWRWPLCATHVWEPFCTCPLPTSSNPETWHRWKSDACPRHGVAVNR